MAIIFLHGDNQVETRNRLQEYKTEAQSSNKEVLVLDGERMQLVNFIQALEANSLFNDQRLLVIENFISAKSPNTEAWEYLKNSEFTPNVVIWEPKKIDKRKLLWLKKKSKNRAEEYNFPDALFQFLDCLGSSFKEKMLILFGKTIKKTAIELVYYMIVRQLRLLLLVKTNSTDVNIKETSRLQSWQIKKLSQQAARFSLKDLKIYYKKLMFIDYQQKTGRSTLNLKQTLDIFLASL